VGPSPAWGHGLFVGDDELDLLLRMDEPARPPEEQREDLRERILASETAGVALPLIWLGRTFGLSSWELEVVVLCLAPEVDSKYERVYAYLQDDAMCRRPSLELALDLLGGDLETRARGRGAFSEQATLRRARILVFVDDGPSQGGPAASRLVKLDDRIVDLLLAADRIPARDWMRVELPADLPAGGTAAQLVSLVRDRGPNGRHKSIFSLHGTDTMAATAIAQEVCAELGVRLVVVDLPVMLAAGSPFESSIREAAREAILQPAALVFQHADQLGDTRTEADLRERQLASALDDFAWLAFVCGRHPLRGGPGARHHWVPVEVEPPDLAEQSSRWQAALSQAGMEIGGREADSLASRYRLGRADMESVLDIARTIAQLRGPSARVERSDVERACRDLVGPSLAGLARRIVPRYTWADIVLPADQLQHLREIAAAVASRRLVLADWGFGKKVSRGRGLSALFGGSPGTGKTMAAEILAGELGLDLYAVDLATVVSKYIGETEKNLSRIFDAAESTSSLLFFDEADGLFSQRTELKDAHDRYANIEISYLLQRIESYAGLVILATNLRRNMDEAFLRRLNFIVEFPVPGTPERLRIWRTLMPTEAPLAPDVDWEFLANRFVLSGGHIRNAVLHAAHQAAAGGRAIGMAELLLGVKRELEKLGKVNSASDFGKYSAILKGAP
jgi:SpoVK/Ycf46/Vps4 family AAA+-type ATPase